MVPKLFWTRPKYVCHYVKIIFCLIQNNMVPILKTCSDRLGRYSFLLGFIISKLRRWVQETRIYHFTIHCNGYRKSTGRISSKFHLLIYIGNFSSYLYLINIYLFVNFASFMLNFLSWYQKGFLYRPFTLVKYIFICNNGFLLINHALPENLHIQWLLAVKGRQSQSFILQFQTLFYAIFHNCTQASTKWCRVMIHKKNILHFKIFCTNLAGNHLVEIKICTNICSAEKLTKRSTVLLLCLVSFSVEQTLYHIFRPTEI